MAPALSSSSFRLAAAHPHYSSKPHQHHRFPRSTATVVFAKQGDAGGGANNGTAFPSFRFGGRKGSEVQADEGSGDGAQKKKPFFMDIDFGKLPDPKSLVPAVAAPGAAGGSTSTALLFGSRRRKDPRAVFVAGAMGQSGVRIARTLLRQGFSVRAGVPELAAAQELARIAVQYKIISPEESKRLNAVESAFGDAESIAKAIGNATKVVVSVGRGEDGPSGEVTTDDALQVVRAAQLAGVAHVTVVYDTSSDLPGAASTYNVLDGITSFFNNIFARSQAPLTLGEFLNRVAQETEVRYTLIKASLGDDDVAAAEGGAGSLAVAAEGTSESTKTKVSKWQVASLVAEVFSSTSVAENKVVEVSVNPSASSKKSIEELFRSTCFPSSTTSSTPSSTTSSTSTDIGSYCTLSSSITITTTSSGSRDKIEPSSASNYITKMIKSRFPGPIHQFSDFPMDIQDVLFEDFMRQYTFTGPSDANKARLAWTKTAQTNFKRLLYNVRRNKGSQYGGDMAQWRANRPMAQWRANRPTWMRQEYWEGLCDIWAGERWIEKSVKMKANRAAQPEKNVHTGGSVSFATHKSRLETQLKRLAQFQEVFDKTHKKKGTDDYISARAQETAESYSKAMGEKYGDEAEQPELDPEIWVEASGGAKKGHVYGFGHSLGTSRVLLSCASSASHVTSPFTTPAAPGGGSRFDPSMTQDQLKEMIDTSVSQAFSQSVPQIVSQAVSSSVTHLLAQIGLLPSGSAPPTQQTQAGPSGARADDQNDNAGHS